MAYSPVNNELIHQGWDYTLARWISNILNPPLVAAFGIFAMALFIGTPEALRWAFFFVFVVVSIPTLYVFWLLRQGKITSFHIPKRETRFWPYIVIISCNLVAVVVMLLAGAPFLLLAFAVIGVVQSTLMFVINMYWKISGHTTAISGLSVFMVAALGWSMSPVLVMVPLVAWARIRTRSHSFWQTMAGVLTGTVFILATWYLISLSCKNGVIDCV